MTPRELSTYADAYNNRIENEQEEKRQELYISALLISRFVWAKQIPEYEELFGKEKNEEMTDEQMLKTVEALNAMFGGSDTRKEAFNGSC